MSKRTPDLDGRQIDAQLTRSPWCIWPECREMKLHNTMVCHHHAAHCAELVYSLRELPRETVDARALERESLLDHFLRASEKSPTTTEKRTYVYIIQVDDLIKIGYTSKPHQRLRSYPPNTKILAVFPGTKQLEAELHGRFRFALRKGREWFRPADEILEYVNEQVEKHGQPTTYMNLYRDPGPKPTVGTRNWAGIKKTAA